MLCMLERNEGSLISRTSETVTSCATFAKHSSESPVVDLISQLLMCSYPPVVDYVPMLLLLLFFRDKWMSTSYEFWKENEILALVNQASMHNTRLLFLKLAMTSVTDKRFWMQPSGTSVGERASLLCSFSFRQSLRAFSRTAVEES